jgi:hypothetical protein
MIKDVVVRISGRAPMGPVVVRFGNVERVWFRRIARDSRKDGAQFDSGTLTRGSAEPDRYRYLVLTGPA